MTDPQNTDSRSANLIRLAAAASVAVAVVLIVVKFLVWFVTDSLSVLASMVDSILDAAASLINLLAIRYSMKSPDEEHPFGHGKVEYLAGLGQAVFVACSALFIIFHAFNRFGNPQPLESTGMGIGVMGLAVLLTLVLVLFQQRVAGITGSTAIRADSLHYAADLFTNLATMAALGLAWVGWPGLDPFFAIGIALVVIYNAWQIGYESTQMLMDCQLSPEVAADIIGIASGHRDVIGVHDLRTRRSGQTRIIQLHLELKGDLPLAEAHRVAKEVEGGIHTLIPDADIIIHQDPV